MKPYLKFFLVFLTGAFASSFSYAQEPQKKPAITKIAKFKPPVVKSALGVNTNNSGVTVDEANQLIALPLKITDAQNNSYLIDSYNFLYKRKGVVEDEETGRKQIKFTTVSDVFRKTPLPKVWIDNIQNGFQKDEEILFFDIVVKDKTGRRFFAPDLKITIQ
ncbi:MAG: hypothetical protein ABJA90_07410 [Ginsengibacter sp.]